MKYIPNVLSFLRLIAIIPLLILTPLELPFMIVYVAGGLSDMLDGPIARKFNVTSQFGAALDGLADLLFLFTVLFRIGPLIEFSNWLWIWIGIAIAAKLLASVIGYMRHKEIIFLHTYFGKFFMFNLFLFPMYYLFLSADLILITLLVFVTVVITEDIYINSTSKEVNLDHKGILFQDK